MLGCANSPDETLQPQDVDPLLQRIHESVKVIQSRSRDLHAIESARYRELTGKNLEEHDLSLAPGLLKVVSLGANWNGPLDKLITQLSVMANLNPPRFLRIQPAGGILVSVDTDYRRISDMMADVSAQAGTRAKITLKMRERLFEVEYLSY